MTTFIRTHRSSRHVGARRFASAGENAQQDHRGMDGALGLATLLLSALAAALMVVADQLMGSLAEAHLLVMWMVLWVTGFVALVLFSGLARAAATRINTGMDDRSRGRGEARAGRAPQAIRCTAADAPSEAETYCDVVKPQLRTMSARARRLARFS